MKAARGLSRRRLFLSAPAFLGVGPAFAATTKHGTSGPLNLITDVDGLQIGQAQDERVRTGVTVLLPDRRVTCAVDVRGGGPGTRETDALTPWNLVRSVDAIVLSGGSVYGLAASDGVAAVLGAQGRGFALGTAAGVPVSPIVPSAILYDLANGGDKRWGTMPPYRALGVAALHDVRARFALGTAGAGYGATAGTLKGGIGSASFVSHDGITVGAIVACNSLGSVTVPGTNRFWAAPFEIDREFGGLGAASVTVDTEDWGDAKINPSPRANTTLACVATDAALDPDECRRVAMMAQDGLARAIRPVHSPFDGDTVFALSTGRRPLPAGPRALLVARIGAIAADVLARSIARGVYEARMPAGMAGQSWSMLKG